MRFLARFVPQPEAPSGSFLNILLSLAKNLGASARNPKWTSYGALEIDIFTKSEADFEALLAVLEPLANVEFTRNLEEPPAHRDKKDAIELAVSYFNHERFWESHEILESVWRVSGGAEKSLLQGMILVDAAFVHVQKNETQVALGVLRRALRQLESKERLYEGVDIFKLRERAEEIIRKSKFEVFRI